MSEKQISKITQKLEKMIDDLNSVYGEIDKLEMTEYISVDIVRLEYTIDSSIFDLIDIINRKLGGNKK